MYANHIMQCLALRAHMELNIYSQCVHGDGDDDSSGDYDDDYTEKYSLH